MTQTDAKRTPRPRILLTGKNGQVGWELQRTLACLGDVHAFGSRELDLADADAIREGVRAVRPDIIVNAAAYTAVDRAESEPERAAAINAIAPGILAEEAGRLDALLVHYSTDYVFDGSGERPWTETDTPAPLGVYGRTKRDGERAIQAAWPRHLVLRTSWVYADRGANFLLTMQRLMRERERLTIVDDQVGAPTWSRMIAEATAAILARTGPVTSDVDAHDSRHGIYHLSNGGACSWYGFASAIRAHLAGAAGGDSGLATLAPIPSEAYPTPAARPKNSRLDNSRLEAAFGIRLPAWDDALRLCLDVATGKPT